MATWFITGAARGLGYEIARHALEAGASVVATARSLGQVEAAFSAAPGFSGRLLPVALDVTDERQAAAAAAAAIARFGFIDVLVNNAGRGLLGAVEEASAAEVEAVFATNVFGLLNVTRAVLPPMRAAHSGHVASSIAVRCTPRRTSCRTMPPPPAGCGRPSRRATAVRSMTRPRARR